MGVLLNIAAGVAAVLMIGLLVSSIAFGLGDHQ